MNRFFPLTTPVNMRRQMSAWLLLLVFVPTMVLMSVHHHAERAEQGADCEECVHHAPHAGHFAADGSAVHYCVLCQMHGQAYIVPVVEENVAVLLPARDLCMAEVADVARKAIHALRQRGPPAVCF